MFQYNLYKSWILYQHTLVPGMISSLIDGVGEYSIAVTSECPSVRPNRRRRRWRPGVWKEAPMLLWYTSLAETTYGNQDQANNINKKAWKQEKELGREFDYLQDFGALEMGWLLQGRRIRKRFPAKGSEIHVQELGFYGIDWNGGGFAWDQRQHLVRVPEAPSLGG